MPEFSTGDRVRIDIPDETDPDHEAYHGVHGRVTAILTDDVGEATGDTGDSRPYRVKLEPVRRWISAGVMCAPRSQMQGNGDLCTDSNYFARRRSG